MRGTAPLRFGRGDGSILYGCAGVLLGSLFVWSPEPLFAAPLAIWAAAGLLQMIWADFSLRRISVRFLAPPRAFRAGQRLVLQVELTNDSRWFRHGPVCLVHSLSDRMTELPSHLARDMPGPGRSRLVELDFGSASRGRPAAALGLMTTQAPFGLFRAERRLDLHVRLIVWPARQKNLPPLARPPGRPSPRSRSVTGSGRRLAPSVERERTRAYQAGDPARSIHWKLSARVGELIVVDTRGPLATRFWLQLETFGAAWTERAQFERALRVLAALAEDGFVSGRLHGVVLNRRPRQIADRHALCALLDQLSGLPAPSGAPARVHRPEAPRETIRRDVLRLVPEPDGKVALVNARDEALFIV